ncbi:MAG TPA: universal stress protein [Pirellulales bacterium]
MSVFNSVLVGIDLLQEDGHDASRFSLPVEEAIKHALWLAEKTTASVTFFAVLNDAEDTLPSPKADDSCLTSQLHRSGQQALDRLVDSATKRGLIANAKLVSGEAWVEIIREVEQSGHDVVIVGTRNVRGLRRLLFGSTATRLLHNCPCPVWVTRPESKPIPHKILITSDFSPVSDITVKLGLAIGELSGAKVSVLHSVDYLLDRRYSVGLLHTNTEAYHAHVKAEAHERLTEQLARVVDGPSTATVDLQIVGGESVPDTAIVEFIEHHQIDLLMMGTIARGGLPGLTIGNTAERLVTHVPCSMLAVKPADFKSPIASTAATKS